AVGDLCETLPELSDRLRPIGVATVARLSEVGTSDTVTLHNDMHFKQVRVRSKRIGILDLDRLAIGDPLIDVANFATQLCMLGVRTDHSIDAATARGWANAFLDEWGRATGRPIDAGRYRCYAVLSLVELARGMMRHLRTGWRALAGRCVDQAEAELAAVGPEAVVA
ncbi:MAG: phosphotransferase, partial [Planctomycetes bacterium]|nr:phosphotransferase [Planctomycetota bacterium]